MPNLLHLACVVNPPSLCNPEYSLQQALNGSGRSERAAGCWSGKFLNSYLKPCAARVHTLTSDAHIASCRHSIEEPHELGLASA